MFLGWCPIKSNGLCEERLFRKTIAIGGEDTCNRKEDLSVSKAGQKGLFLIEKSEQGQRKAGVGKGLSRWPGGECLP